MLAGIALIGVTVVAAIAGVGSESGSDVAARFAEYDLDGDGLISRREAEAVSAGLYTHFAKFDRDGDGALTLSEFRGPSEMTSAED